jgi:hypothetical protein
MDAQAQQLARFAHDCRRGRAVEARNERERIDLAQEQSLRFVDIADAGERGLRHHGFADGELG